MFETPAGLDAAHGRIRPRRKLLSAKVNSQGLDPRSCWAAG
jgi:hypothetical protein